MKFITPMQVLEELSSTNIALLVSNPNKADISKDMLIISEVTDAVHAASIANGEPDVGTPLGLLLYVAFRAGVKQGNEEAMAVSP